MKVHGGDLDSSASSVYVFQTSSSLIKTWRFSLLSVYRKAPMASSMMRLLSPWDKNNKLKKGMLQCECHQGSVRWCISDRGTSVRDMGILDV